jgi:hypothetical protein
VRVPIPLRCLALLIVLACLARAQRYSDFTTPRPLPPGSVLVIGFLGGIEHWNSEGRPVNRLAAELRERKIPGVYVETVEHKHRDLAKRLVLEAFDRNGDGKLDEQECAAARLILYGHSMGGASVVKLARELGNLGVPVLLTVQLDSIGRGDRDIPVNVARAANFYQRNGSPFLRGQPEIRADDPARTTILGNFKYDYRKRNVDLSGVNPIERATGGSHTKMEFDPEVWQRVESLILKEIEEQPLKPQQPAPL